MHCDVISNKYLHNFSQCSKISEYDLNFGLGFGFGRSLWQKPNNRLRLRLRPKTDLRSDITYDVLKVTKRSLPIDLAWTLIRDVTTEGVIV